jgi:hypothetical protein
MAIKTNFISIIHPGRERNLWVQQFRRSSIFVRSSCHPGFHKALSKRGAPRYFEGKRGSLETQNSSNPLLNYGRGIEEENVGLV